MCWFAHGNWSNYISHCMSFLQPPLTWFLTESFTIVLADNYFAGLVEWCTNLGLCIQLLLFIAIGIKLWSVAVDAFLHVEMRCAEEETLRTFRGVLPYEGFSNVLIPGQVPIPVHLHVLRFLPLLTSSSSRNFTHYHAGVDWDLNQSKARSMQMRMQLHTQKCTLFIMYNVNAVQKRSWFNWNS